MQLFYTVLPGDTMSSIAMRWSIPLRSLIAANNISAPNMIFPGQQLSMPPGGQGQLATLLYDDIQNYIDLYDPATGTSNAIAIEEAGRNSSVFWSPNQRLIAYVGNSGIISIVEISTGKITKIDQISFPAFVDWSYDSNKLVYSTGNLVRIYNVSSNDFKTINRFGASYVQWFPDNTELLYEAKDTSGTSQLYKSNSDGSNEMQITKTTNGPLNYVRLSPNGRYVLYTSPGASISEIYTMDLTTGTIYKIPGGPEVKNYYPTWSPDSTKIAYSSTTFRNGKYYSLIRVSGVKGEGDTTIANSSCYATPVTWSPDSKRIAYLSGCREDNPPVEVWSIDLRKSVPINVLSGFSFYHLDWSPTR